MFSVGLVDPHISKIDTIPILCMDIRTIEAVVSIPIVEDRHEDPRVKQKRIRKGEKLFV